MSPGAAIVFVHSSDELYGADRMLMELVDAVPPGHPTEVWLPTDTPHPAEPLCAVLKTRGVVVRHVDLPVLRRAYRTPRDLLRLAGRVLRLLPALRRAAPGLVYCTTSAVFLAAVAARAARVPTVVGHVQEFWSTADRAVLTPMARCCHRLVAISAAVAADLPVSLRSRTVLVVNATPDPGSVSPVAADGRLRFLVSSRWNGWKGHRTLLDAWRLADSPGHLTVLGGPPASGESTDVRRLVAELPDPSSVRIVGEVSDPSGYVREADVVVVPSDEPEPFGLVAIEAFARGRPVIASDAGGLADIVTDGLDGWLFAPRDSSGLATILIGLTPSRTAAAGKAARATYEAAYTVARYADEWRRAVGFGRSD